MQWSKRRRLWSECGVSKLKRVELFGVLAGAIGIAAAGFSAGTYIADLGNQKIAEALGQQIRSVLPEGAESKVVSEIEAGNLEEATRLLSSGVQLVDSAPCVQAGKEALIELGGYVDQCESQANIVHINNNPNGNCSWAQFMINGESTGLCMGQRAKISETCEITALQLKMSDSGKSDVLVRFTCN